MTAEAGGGTLEVGTFATGAECSLAGKYMKTFIKAKRGDPPSPPRHSDMEAVNKHSSNTRAKKKTNAESFTNVVPRQSEAPPPPTLLLSAPAFDFQSSISHHPSISADGGRGGHKSKVTREPLQDEPTWGDGSLRAFGCKMQEGCVYTAPACLSIT